MNPDSIKTGGPAFPVGEDALMRNLQGMNLRDYFSAMAMQGMLSKAGVFSDAEKPRNIDGWMFADCARCAYSMADAMLAARAQNPEASHE